MAVDASAALGNQALLSKIDKLRELNVGSIVPLPQLVVVGDQSSGKSSVLESLTGFSFPRSTTLCTRYATQITCRREAQKNVAISIIPRPDSDAERTTNLRGFHRSVPDYAPQDNFASIFEDASKAMGIRTGDADGTTDSSAPTFSEDILKIEITGPNENHLTVIDVPGIFRAATPGLTTDADISLVNNMVKRYMKDSRTIILAVIPCTVDVATQEILKLATDADPEGVRTMGVLTMPDLVTEDAKRQNVFDLVLGKRNDLMLGYCVVKNRGADDHGSSLEKRHIDELDFFRGDAWAPIADTGRIGIASLKKRLGEILMDISRREFPAVKMETRSRLDKASARLEALGEERADVNSQRAYLTKFSVEFQRVVGFALNAYYTEHPVFDNQEEARLITRVVALNEAFSDALALRGHTRRFKVVKERNGHDVMDQNDTESFEAAGRLGLVDFEILPQSFSEIQDIIDPDVTYFCNPPSSDSIMNHIEVIFKRSRGPKLGTFGGSLLGTTFKEQSKKWHDLVMAHTSNVIAVVHHFIFTALKACSPDGSMLNEVWESFLLDELRTAYARAMGHARFLLDIERNGKPLTLNHYFNDNLKRGRNGRLEAAARSVSKTGATITGEHDCSHRAHYHTGASDTSLYVALDDLGSLAKNKSNAQQAYEDIHDILKSYYKVSRKRFVDVICQQVIDHFLLHGNGVSPLRAFCPEEVARMSDEQLGRIAGEDAATKDARRGLAATVKQLTAAMVILKG